MAIASKPPPDHLGKMRANALVPRMPRLLPGGIRIRHLSTFVYLVVYHTDTAKCTIFKPPTPCSQCN